RRHEVLARRIGGDAYEVEDRLLRRSVVPRRERRPGLGLRRSGVEKCRQGGWYSRECAQHKAAAWGVGTKVRHVDSPLSVPCHAANGDAGDLSGCVEAEQQASRVAAWEHKFYDIEGL